MFVVNYVLVLNHFLINFSITSKNDNTNNFSTHSHI